MSGLHAAAGVDVSPVFLGVLTLAGLASAGLLGLGLAAFLRRRTRPYLLVALALGTLFARSLVAAASMTALLDVTSHHFLEHALDVAMAALVVAAVYSVGGDASTHRRQ
jgi:transketolase C-terminal domain/subunit